MRTEATPTSIAQMIMAPVSAECKRQFRPAVSGCAQIVPKISQEYQNVSKDIELYRNLGAPKDVRFTTYVLCYLRFPFFRRFLHTGEVRGSSPLSPTIPA